MPGRHHEDDVNLIVAGSGVDPESMRPLTERSTGYRMDYESENFVVSPPVSASDGYYGNNTEAEALVVAHGLRASDGHHGHSSPRDDGADNLIASPLTASYAKQADSSDTSSGPPNLLNIAAGVRRLTPLEAERLMGWPDGWTKYTADGREIADSHRYRMCGNGIIATVAEWLGHRLMRAAS